MNNSFSPTKEQADAISAEGNMVITACPGSGKTTVIVEKMRNEIDGLNEFQGVIGITFTVKASKELRKRCKAGAFNTKSSFFGTIDHFCLSEIIFPFANRIFEKTDLEIECISYKDLDAAYKQSLPDLSEPKVVLRTTDYHVLELEFQRHYSEGFVLLEAIGVIANMILQNSEACRRYIRSKYTSIYIDEYQDSSEPQHKLFLNMLGLGLKAIAVGDVNQSIYEWRGSDSKYINELIEETDTFQHHRIDVNHRCHPSITNYANRLFDQNATLLPTNQIRVFQRQFNGIQTDLAQQLNDYIPQTAQSFGVELSEVAVLVRRNSGLEGLIEHLTIPFRVYTDDSLSSVNSKITKLYQDLLKYRFNLDFLVSDVSEFEAKANSLTLVSRAEVINSIKRVRNVTHDELESALHHTCRMLFGHTGKDVEHLALQSVLENPNHLKQYKPNENEVQVMTLHKSKGLEFEIVFHLDLYEWVFPFRQYTGDFNEYIFPDWDQDLNLHYVGITRAKQACILAYSTRRLNGNGENRQGQPSQFLNMPGLNGLYA
ncbi:ATP-dependent helicase [Vibrio diabolicus]|uniref:UvrD-helicase domain-containing protein n=1 Tax=Vibrio diabolicus TaxID=50719 RepID=UPI00211B3D0B|nr:ATP-dependent helicase [Vibrio diabolicus]MCG9620004.1 ATP-dependent helicase [Vibrio diabolicus]HDY7752859.1 ATP-dependent helicase [Vibrio vulnificus]